VTVPGVSAQPLEGRHTLRSLTFKLVMDEEDLATLGISHCINYKRRDQNRRGVMIEVVSDRIGCANQGELTRE
jgi:hypothetical protein